jgi:hypothetical protein
LPPPRLQQKLLKHVAGSLERAESLIEEGQRRRGAIMEDTFEVTLSQEDRYRFHVDSGDESGALLQTDEPEPLGEGTGPNAARVLATAIVNRLSASLVYRLDNALEVRAEAPAEASHV